MRHLIGNQAFVRFWLAGFFVVLASWILFITMQVMVFDLTGSPFATGMILVCMSIPGVLLGPVAGVLVDRWIRKRVMAFGALALAVLLLAALPFARDVSVVTLYAIVFVQGVIMAFYTPAENALLPSLVREEDLAPANTFNAMNDNFGNIIGPSVGALLYVQVGFVATLAVCAVLFLAGWVVIASIQASGEATSVEATSGSTTAGLRAAARSVLCDLRLGLDAVRSRAVLLVAVVAFGLYVLADTPLTAVLPAFVGGSLGVGPEAFGTMMTIRGITGLLGGVVIAAVSRRVPEATLLACGLFVYGASIATWGAINTYALGLLITLPVGLAAAAIRTGVFTLLQKASPPAMRGRVFGLVGTVNGTIGLGISLAAGSLGEVAGTRAVVILSGCLQVFPLLLVTARLRPWRRAVARQPV
jgi:MFS family permease